jgi:hypothetical protein
MRTTQGREKIQVFAVIRIDRDRMTEDAITIKEILPTREQAAEEVERLNALNEPRGARYFWQATRYFPSGRTL